jgi:hypothetical protein
MKPILNPRNRGIIYSAIALGFMAWAIVSTFFSFDFGFINKSWEVIVRPEAPIADEWETGHRTVYGAELKMEAAVVIGLGITVFFFIAQGFLWS